MPFLENASAVLEAYLSGEAGAGAIAEILFGKACPCGKLAETFPNRIEDTPAYLNFPGNGRTVRFGEDIFVGYRYYEKRDVPVLFPFGYGLSYTSFEYSGLELSAGEIGENDELKVRVKVKNTGNFDGKETVQLYVGENSPKIVRPVKELKGFKKIELKKGEEKTVEFTLDRRSFAYWDERLGKWNVNSGKFGIFIGAASSDIRAVRKVTVHAEQTIEKLTIYSYLRDLRMHPNGKSAVAHILKLMGKKESEIFSDSEKDALTSLDWCPLRNVVTMYGMKMSIDDLKKLLEEVNG